MKTLKTADDIKFANTITQYCKDELAAGRYTIENVVMHNNYEVSESGYGVKALGSRILLTIAVKPFC
jgi:hypothetical protein